MAKETITTYVRIVEIYQIALTGITEGMTDDTLGGRGGISSCFMTDTAVLAGMCGMEVPIGKGIITVTVQTPALIHRLKRFA
jgi:hypothetical protein